MTEIKYIPIGEIKPYSKNAKKHPKKQVEQVAASIKEFGFNQPLVLDKNGVLIVGHGRLEAAKLLGYKEVPAITIDLPEEKAKAYRLADNKLNESDWDMGLVIEELKELSLPMLELTGFEKDLIIEPDEKDDQVPDVPEEPKAKLGDIYQLGKHRIMCGDSTKLEDVESLMNGQKADMVFTDPPYGVSYADKNQYLNSISPGNRIQEPIKNDHLSIESTADDLIYPAFCNIKEVLGTQGVYYITAPQGGELLMMMMMMMKAGIPLRHMIIWAKNNHVLGRTDYNYKHEPILYGWVNTHKFYGHGAQKFSVWNVNKPLKSDLHPTMKPVELIVNAVLNSTQSENNIVTDLFLGSGSTLIACEKTGRVCYGMELDPKYVDVIVKRWEDYTGQKAVLLNNEKQL